MRYFEISEGSMGRTYESVRSKPISIEEAGSLIRENCSDIVNKQSIWRGIRKEIPALFVDSTIGQRQSANTESYMNLILDNSKHWSKFPDRSKSLICSNDGFVANSYGRIYRVFPYNGVKIGICPRSDFWLSFKEIHVARFNSAIDQMYKYFFNESLPEDSNIMANISRLSDKIASNKDALVALINDAKDYRLGEAARYIQYITDDLSAETLNDFVDYYLNPLQQDFKLKTTRSFYKNESKTENEIWFSGKAIMVKQEFVQDTLSSAFTYLEGTWH